MPPKKDESAPVKKKKEPPKELCGCGYDTYRPPPKGKKKAPAPIEHAAGCAYQRTVCTAYPYLPLCAVCCNPCKFCGGTNRWCPHCYERRCTNIYKRIVHGNRRMDGSNRATMEMPTDILGTASDAMKSVLKASVTR
ncbi:hypothetical protein TRVL_00417 [Trypanosoma vivax]|uniref:Uncharacterized protein n=1 Tax=Trypanosoma vivax (strain Y486) TaxID=1055687 RepID=G0U7U4_TRYVY|nr:hypothetical protein TRVL_00417 [Trypanosoma vivax]CCC51952.1 conserved hypothetical protein [Trypanosoma vivax Y486]